RARLRLHHHADAYRVHERDELAHVLRRCWRGPRVAVEIDDRVARPRHRVLGYHQRRARPVLDDRGRRDRRLALRPERRRAGEEREGRARDRESCVSHIGPHRARTPRPVRLRPSSIAPTARRVATSITTSDAGAGWPPACAAWSAMWSIVLLFDTNAV